MQYMPKKIVSFLLIFSIFASPFFCASSTTIKAGNQTIKSNEITGQKDFKSTILKKAGSSICQLQKIVSKIIESTKKIIRAKKTKKAFYYSLAGISASCSAISWIALYIFIKSLNDIKSSSLKTVIYNIIKQLLDQFSVRPELNKYIIPAIIFTLASNGLVSAGTALVTFLAGHKVN